MRNFPDRMSSYQNNWVGSTGLLMVSRFLLNVSGLGALWKESGRRLTCALSFWIKIGLDKLENPNLSIVDMK